MLLVLSVVVVIVVVLVFVFYKRKVPTSEKFSLDFAPDLASLQYNITNHPMRNRILQLYSPSQPPAAPSVHDVEDLRSQLNQWYTTAVAKGVDKPMDQWCKIAIEAALDSAAMGNWPIGNVICYMPEGTENDPRQWIEILRGGNRVFTRNPRDLLAVKDFVPRFDSHAHGEMVVLDAFEDRLCRGCYDKTSPNYMFQANSPIDFRKRSDIVGYGMPDNIVMFTQLNSCQMCLSRIGNAGISRCYWIAPDSAGGMAHRLCDSVPAYFNMLNRQIHAVADASTALIDFAFRSFSGPNAEWVTYCTWKLGQLGAPKNMMSDYKYCVGQYYANTAVGQNTMYDPTGFFRTVDTAGGPTLSCSVKPPPSM